MVDKFKIERGVDQDVRKQITTLFDDIDARIILIEEYLGNSAPSGGVTFRLRFNASTAAGDPGTGYIAVNNSDPQLVTQLYASTTADTGNDIGPLLLGMDVGAIIGIFEGLAPNATAYFRIAGPGLDAGTYVRFDIVEISTTAALPADQALCDIYLVESSERLLPPGGNTHDILRKATDEDYDTEWVDGDTMFTPVEHWTDLDNPHEVTHAQVLGKTPDDHHNQVHLLYGPDHGDVNNGNPLETRHVLGWDGAFFRPEFRMNWRGAWGPQEYQKNDVAVDFPYLGVANKVTSERLAPQPLGSPTWSLPDVPPFLEYVNTSVVYSGHQYVFKETCEIRGLRVWIPEVSANTNYRFVIVANPNTNPTYTTIEEPVLNEGDWTLLLLDTVLVTAGTELIVYIDALNSGNDQTWAYNWLREADNNVNPPAAGNWNKTTQNNTLRINHLDAEAVPVDHQLELQVVAGTIFEISEVGNPQNFIHFRTEGTYTEGVGFTSYPVSVVDQGIGIPAVSAPCQIRAIQPIADPTKYVAIGDYWTANQPLWANVTSFLRFDGVDPGPSPDNAYGVDLAVQRLSVSEHWDIAAISGGSGSGGGGGGEPFPEPADDGQVYGRETGNWQPVYRKTEAAPIVHTHVEADITDLDKYTKAEVDASQATQDTAISLNTDHRSATNNPHGVTPAQIGAAPDPHTHDPFAGGNSTGFVPNPLTANNRFLRDDGTWQDVNTVPSGGVSTKYFFNSQTTNIPGTGEISVNNADQTLATAILANRINQEGNDLSAWLGNLIPGDYVGLNATTGSGENIWYRVSANPVEVPPGWNIPVSYESAAGGIPNLAEVDLIIAGNPEARVPSGGLTGQHLAKNSDTSYDTVWVDTLQLEFLIITNDYTAKKGDNLAVDTTLGPVQITLPVSPAVEDSISIIDPGGEWATNNVTVIRSGQTIDGLAEDFILDLDWGQCRFMFDGTTWLINPDGIGTQGTQGEQGEQGQQGDQGPPGNDGSDGADGVGVPAGGTANQTLTKVDGTDYNTQWKDPTWLVNGTDIYSANSGHVGINNTSPVYAMEIRGNTGQYNPTIRLQGDLVANAWARVSFASRNADNTGWTEPADFIYSTPSEFGFRSDSAGQRLVFRGPTDGLVRWYGGSTEVARFDLSGPYFAFGTTALYGTMNIKGNTNVTEADFAIRPNASTSERKIDIGAGRTASGVVQFNMMSSADDASAGYGIRWIRWQAGDAGFYNRSGNTYFVCEAASKVMTFSTVNTERMRIASDGKVGIGTTSPARKLSVYEDSGSNAVATIGGSTANSYLSFTSSGTTNDTQVAIGANNNDMRLLAGGSEWMRILSTGNVGIGTTSPQRTLHVYGGTSDVIFSGPQGYSKILLPNSVETTAENNWIGSLYNHLYFGTLGTQRMMIYNNGTVRIGSSQTIPSYTLQVDGTVNATGGYWDNGSPVVFNRANNIEDDTPPVNSNDPGAKGDVRYDDDYIYLCVQADTWKRTPLSTW